MSLRITFVDILGYILGTWDYLGNWIIKKAKFNCVYVATRKFYQKGLLSALEELFLERLILFIYEVIYRKSGQNIICKGFFASKKERRGIHVFFYDPCQNHHWTHCGIQ